MTAHALSPLWIEAKEAASTNTLLASMDTGAPGIAPATFLWTDRQTAGRGQRGNSWEAAPGLNITLSALFRPDRLDARCQFAVSEAVALAVVHTVDSCFGRAVASVKWPNDIYVGDRKICGILIEHTLSSTGKIARTIAGVGLNVNQRVWVSDAPNPVSLYQIAGKEFALPELREHLAREICGLMEHIGNQEGRDDLHRKFMNRLWRGGDYVGPYRDAATGELFFARITGVESTGHLHLTETSGRERVYAFKEVSFVLGVPDPSYGLQEGE